MSRMISEENVDKNEYKPFASLFFTETTHDLLAPSWLSRIKNENLLGCLESRIKTLISKNSQEEKGLKKCKIEGGGRELTVSEATETTRRPCLREVVWRLI